MFGITDLKKGVLIQLDGKPYRVVEYSQKVMAKKLDRRQRHS
jgi:elongation factor P